MLEERLATIATMVDPETRLADIGTDHAYLPIELVKEGKIDYAIASDVAKGPLDNAKTDILEAGLQDRIETRLGSGLETIEKDDNIETVVIAGMGGKLMKDLLETAKNQGDLYPTLILEPNVGEDIVRKWLSDNGYRILDEKIIEVAGHIYEIIKSKKDANSPRLDDYEIKFGPFLVKEKNDVFKKKWEHQIDFQNNLLKNLAKAKQPNEEKIEQTKDFIKMIEEVLND